MCPMATPPNLNKIGSDGFDLIEKHYGRFRRHLTPEVTIIIDSKEAAALFGGANIQNNEKPKPPRRNWADFVVWWMLGVLKDSLITDHFIISWFVILKHSHMACPCYHTNV
ncbi:hypothetical protein VNO77_23647 [Canavalia gladiata]|uniref:Uncharacterized protein n=1 Tax=Canavalia gladiata TaxID=3824 RepID=A0AAN9QFI5_CANGL